MDAKTRTKDNEVPKREPVKVIRVGAIAASIWRRQTPTGFEYLDFSLSRSWKLKSGEREGYSQNFFENNEEALFEVINQATRYIRQQAAKESAETNFDADTSREAAGLAA